MATPVLLPKLDMTMTEGTLSRWHKQEGEQVNAGDLLFEVEADKLNMEMEAPASGTLRGVKYEAGARLPVGTVLAYVLAAGEELPAEAAPAGMPEAPESPDARVRATPAARRLALERGIDLRRVAGSGPNGRVHEADVAAAALPARVTPLARKLAAERGLDPAHVQGTGTGGKVMRADLDRLAAPAPEAACPAVPAPAGPGERVPLTGARRVIARRMTESWTQAPHVTLTLEADCAELVRLRKRLGEAAGVKLSFNTLISAFTARTLVQFPLLNTTWDGEDLVRSQAVHLAVAVDTPNGLMVPVVRNADSLGLEALGAAIEDLAARARTGSLTPGEMSGGTFTVSNLGGFGIEGFTPIINPPQVAVLGVGAIIEKVVPVGGVPAVRPRVTLSLSFDHRALDGADGARFLAALRSLIECPERALL